MQLRDYQSAASASVFNILRAGGHPVVQLPTGTGKSLVIADIASRLRKNDGRVWVVTHVQELITQNIQTLDRFAGLAGTGIVCAGLNQDTFGSSITFGSVQTLHRRVGSVNGNIPHAIIVDEAHRIPPGDESVMYRKLLTAFPEARRIGMTATPWRLSGGPIYGNDAWFTDLSYVKTPLEMVAAGWLCPLKGVTAEAAIDLNGVHKIAGDFNQAEVDEKVTLAWANKLVDSVLLLAKGRKHILVFAPMVRTAILISEVFNSRKVSATSISAEDPDRSEKLAMWKAGETRVLCNVEILTTGFDFPELDCLVCVRPTESSSLWIQIMGRAMRIASGKKDALILDYAGNLTRLGGVSMVEDFYVEKKGVLVKGAQPITKAPVHGRRLPARGLALIDPMSGSAKEIAVRVLNVSYIVIPSRKQIGKSMVMIVYSCETEEGFPISASDFLCVEYAGWARQKAESWFARRGATAPYSAREAQAQCWGLPLPRKIVVKKNGQYINVVRENFDGVSLSLHKRAL